MKIDTSSTGSSVTFRIPTSIATGYYQLYLTDDTNQGYRVLKGPAEMERSLRGAYHALSIRLTNGSGVIAQG